jgi:hypothetical protein
MHVDQIWSSIEPVAAVKSYTRSFVFKCGAFAIFCGLQSATAKQCHSWHCNIFYNEIHPLLITSAESRVSLYANYLCSILICDHNINGTYYMDYFKNRCNSSRHGRRFPGVEYDKHIAEYVVSNLFIVHDEVTNTSLFNKGYSLPEVIRLHD